VVKKFELYLRKTTLHRKKFFPQTFQR